MCGTMTRNSDDQGTADTIGGSSEQPSTTGTTTAGSEHSGTAGTTTGTELWNSSFHGNPVESTSTPMARADKRFLFKI